MKKLAYDCILFEKCNLNCKHCFQQIHKTSWDQAAHKTLLSTFKDSFIKQYEARDKQLDQLTVSFCGGELFMDGVLDDQIYDYQKLHDEISTIVFNENYSGQLSFEFISNGVFTKRDRVLKLLENTNSTISISYDPVHRYRSEKQKQLVVDNIAFFDNHNVLDEISITLTKQSIQHYVNNDDLKQFTNNSIGINYYIGSGKNCQSLIPSDDDYWDFWKYCVDKQYYNIKALNQFSRSITQNKRELFCICDDKLIIRNGTATYNCAKYSYGYNDHDFYSHEYITEENVRLIKRTEGQYKRGCMWCPHISICPGMCWLSILFKHSTITDNCPCKRLIEYVKSNS